MSTTRSTAPLPSFSAQLTPGAFGAATGVLKGVSIVTEGAGRAADSLTVSPIAIR